jgi:hypothetical protein
LLGLTSGQGFINLLLSVRKPFTKKVAGEDAFYRFMWAFCRAFRMKWGKGAYCCPADVTKNTPHPLFWYTDMLHT